MGAVRGHLSTAPESVVVSRFSTLIAGLLLAAFSVAIAALVLLAMWRTTQSGRVSLLGTSLVIALSAVAYGLGKLSWRFIANQPNRYKSIFGPIGWKICAAFCMCAALLIGYLAFHEKDIRAIGGMVGALAMGVGSWRRSVAIQEVVDVPSNKSLERSRDE
jgi:hypothetical protein